MKRTFILPLLVLLTLPPNSMGAAHDLTLPPAFTAIYTVKKAGLTLGDVTISLRYDNGRYRYHKKTRSRGLLALFRKDVINETSEGRIDDGRLTMDRYTYVHETGKRTMRHTVRLVAPNRIEEHYKGKEYRYRVPDNTLDRAASEIALMRDARLDKPQLAYNIAERGRAKKLEFIRLGERERNTAAGRFDCREYRVNHNSKKRSTTLCIAPKLDYLPVTVTHVEKGTSFTMWLKEYHPRNRK